MEESLKKLLEDGIKLIDTNLLNSDCFEKLSCLYDQISLFNPVYKLVGAEGKDIVIKHLLDSLAPYPAIAKLAEGKTSFADLGSGSGLPGFVLASAMGDKHFSLVDKMGRRAGFLRNTIALSGMKDRISVVESEVEKLSQSFDCITFRAFRPMQEIISVLDKITVKDSLVFAYKSSEDNIKQEIKVVSDYGKFDFQSIEYKVPFLDAKRSLLILKKLA